MGSEQLLRAACAEVFGDVLVAVIITASPPYEQ